jgi:hypothetical protein
MECGEGVTREMMATAESGNFELRKTKLDLSLITYARSGKTTQAMHVWLCYCIVVL